MKKKILGSLTVMLAGTGLAFAQSPGEIRPMSGDAPAIVVEHARSPYWPNPMALQDCAQPVCKPVEGCKRNNVEGHDLVWASADYLLWWVKKGPQSDPLVTSGFSPGLGTLGAGNTSILFGGSGLDYKTFSGLRLTTGFWFGRDSDWGIEGSGFFTETKPVNFGAASDPNGVPVFARPIVNALTGQETVELVTAFGVASGNVFVNSSSSIFGWELNAVNAGWNLGGARATWMAGYRFLNLEEDINIGQNSVLLPLGTAGFAGSAINMPGSVSVNDHFGANNEFYGLQTGIRLEWASDNWSFSLLGKVAIGDSHEETNIEGATVTATTSTTPQRLAFGGLLALPSNMGRQSHDEFAVVPELAMNVGYQITPLLRAYVGYTVLYWSDVARPGDLINRTVNPSLVPTSQTFNTPGGPLQPSPTFHHSDFWAQGVNFGLEFRY